MKQEYKIGEAAEMLGTTIRTIRYYEEEGLLQPSRTEGGTRLYRESHLHRLRAIMHLAQSDFPLDAIRLLATTREGCTTGDESSREIAALLTQAAKALAARIGALETLRAELLRAKALVGQCHGCRHPPTNTGCPDCPVKKRATTEELPSLIWEQEADPRAM